MSKALITVTEKGCKRCGHSWIPNRPVRPTICPKCKSPYWDKARQKKAVA